MAELLHNRLTLLDLAKRTDPDGAVAKIVEVLMQKNDILQDMSYIEGNLETGHKTTLRTGLPTPTWRLLNQGVQPNKSTTAQVTFNTGIMEAFSEIDCKLADLGGRTREVRFSEDMAHYQGMMHELARTLFYGNERLNPAEFTGMNYYYNDNTAESFDNVINGSPGGSDTDYGSIWLMGWSENTITGIVPKGLPSGIQMEDLGINVSENAGGSGNLLKVYRSHLGFQGGLAVKDWRYGVRIANIRRGELNAAISGNSANLPDLMFQAIDRLPDLVSATPVFYMDRTIMTALRQQLASSVKQSTLTVENVGGVMTTMFQGIPIRRTDALAVTESAVTFP